MANFTSKYVQLTPYCLLEYRYTDLISPERLNYNFIKIVDNHVGATYNQIINVDSADPDTHNVALRSVAKTSGSTYADLDPNQIPPWLVYDTLLSTYSVSGANTPYDTVLFHFLSGYNFDDIDGVILDITAIERSGKPVVLADIAFLRNSDYFVFNPRPIFLGDRLYDRYIQIKIPALKLNNDVFYSLEGHPSQSSTLVAQITSDGRGFLRAQPIQISATDIKNTTTQVIGSATYQIYNIGGKATVSINQADEFSNLSAVIQPSVNGDYFEYFASWEGGFIEDFIFNANSLPGNNYVVLHELRVMEQVGSSFVQTSYFQSIQENNFNQPLFFRPVIINASNAVSFTIEYTARLYNKADSSQIIRIANYTDFNPKAWGGSLSKIQLISDVTPQQIYNKIVAGPTMQNQSFIQTAAQVNPYTTRFVPSFFDRSLVSVNKDTVQLNSDGTLSTTKTASTQPVFGQGDANIIVTPFDNYYKFTILKTEAQNNGTPAPLDLGQNAEYYMVFIDDNGNKNRFLSVTDAIIGDHSKGDLLFKISGDDSEKILKFSSREFWIVSRFTDGSETNIYQGMFNDVTQRAQATANEQAAQDAATANLEQKIRDLEASLAAATSTASTGAATSAATAAPPISTVPAITASGNNQPTTISGVAIPASTTPATVAQIKAQIPGLAVDIPSSKSSIIASIKPKSLITTPVQTTTTQSNLLK